MSNHLTEYAQHLIESLTSTEVGEQRAELRLLLSKRKRSKLWKLSVILDNIAYHYAALGDKSALLDCDQLCNRCGVYSDDCCTINTVRTCRDCMTGQEICDLEETA